jgi:hypothetical protein
MEERRYLILGRQIWSTHIHWLNGRSVPCVELERRCPNCNPQTPKRWAGYLHVWDPATRQGIFLSIPPGAGDDLLAAQPSDYDWRGKYLWARRQTRCASSELIMRVEAGTCDVGALPAELSPADYLDRLFRKVRHLTEPTLAQ